MEHILIHSIEDSLKLLPFLFLTYLAMECLEHHTSDKAKGVIQKSGKFGPVIGSLLGALPQCGFSAAAANLYAGRIITMGTLMAIFLSTSDEMLPILISSSSVPVITIIKILGWKIGIGMAAGIIIDLLVRRRGEEHEMDIHHMCEHEHCNCEKQGVWRSSILHTLQTFLFIFLITLGLNMIMHTVGEDALTGLVFNRPVLGAVLAGLVGLIPNCASSVLITQLYLQGAMSFGAMMAGLLVGAGVGVLVLFKVNDDKRECVRIIGILYIVGVTAGILLELMGVQV